MSHADAKNGQAVEAMVDNADTVATISQRADSALYAAKRAGKNRALSEKDISSFGGNNCRGVAACRYYFPLHFSVLRSWM